MTKLLVAVLGSRRSGKSTTWNTLFGQTVKTGKYARELRLTPTDSVTVFLVSGSAEERQVDIAEIMKGDPDIVLCSVQYSAGADDTFKYFFTRDYTVVVHWLNPGYQDSGSQADSLGLLAWLSHQPTLVGQRDGRVPPVSRVAELKAWIHGWAAQHDLVHKCPQTPAA